MPSSSSFLCPFSGGGSWLKSCQDDIPFLFEFQSIRYKASFHVHQIIIPCGEDGSRWGSVHLLRSVWPILDCVSILVQQSSYVTSQWEPCQMNYTWMTFCLLCVAKQCPEPNHGQSLRLCEGTMKGIVVVLWSCINGWVWWKRYGLLLLLIILHGRVLCEMFANIWKWITFDFLEINLRITTHQWMEWDPRQFFIYCLVYVCCCYLCVNPEWSSRRRSCLFGKVLQFGRWTRNYMLQKHKYSYLRTGDGKQPEIYDPYNI